MEYLKIANSSTMWVLCALVLFAVIIQTIIFIKRGWTEALKLGVSNKTLRKTVTASITLSILPSLPILLVLFVMLPILGIPLPWLRLSIIGSASTELLEATMGIEALGETLGGNISKEAFAAAMWAMTIGGVSATLLTVIILKPISKVYEKFSKGSLLLLSIIGVCSMAGVISSLCTTYVQGSVKSLIVCFTSCSIAVILAILANKNDIFKKISDYSLTICLVFGMVIAILLG
ncbi:MAG: DUF5058 family protein [Tissierellia bacterium]|nr:DUF5058 family protein [Tissierellia bacterium]